MQVGIWSIKYRVTFSRVVGLTEVKDMDYFSVDGGVSVHRG